MQIEGIPVITINGDVLTLPSYFSEELTSERLAVIIRKARESGRNPGAFALTKEQFAELLYTDVQAAKKKAKPDTAAMIANQHAEPDPDDGPSAELAQRLAIEAAEIRAKREAKASAFALPEMD